MSDMDDFWLDEKATWCPRCAKRVDVTPSYADDTIPLCSTCGHETLEPCEDDDYDDDDEGTGIEGATICDKCGSEVEDHGEYGTTCDCFGEHTCEPEYEDVMSNMDFDAAGTLVEAGKCKWCGHMLKREATFGDWEVEA